MIADRSQPWSCGYFLLFCHISVYEVAPLDMRVLLFKFRKMLPKLIKLCGIMRAGGMHRGVRNVTFGFRQAFLQQGGLYGPGCRRGNRGPCRASCVAIQRTPPLSPHHAPTVM